MLTALAEDLSSTASTQLSSSQAPVTPALGHPKPSSHLQGITMHVHLPIYTYFKNKFKNNTVYHIYKFSTVLTVSSCFQISKLVPEMFITGLLKHPSENHYNYQCFRVSNTTHKNNLMAPVFDLGVITKENCKGCGGCKSTNSGRPEIAQREGQTASFALLT